MTNKEIEQLEKTISYISNNTNRRDNKRTPELYTVIVDAVNSDGTVTVHFASDASIQMRIPNLSGVSPNVGGSAYVLTTGGNNMTGSFIVAARGTSAYSTSTMSLSDSNYTISELQSQVENLKTQVKELEDRISILENNSSN